MIFLQMRPCRFRELGLGSRQLQGAGILPLVLTILFLTLSLVPGLE